MIYLASIVQITDFFQIYRWLLSENLRISVICTIVYWRIRFYFAIIIFFTTDWLLTITLHKYIPFVNPFGSKMAL